jgi:hypothetical protein
MKKILILVFAVFLCCAVSAAAQEENPGLSYVNVKVYRVFDSNDAYVVLYATTTNKTASVVIPKAWLDRQPEGTQRKLMIRTLQRPSDPYMTVFYRGGAFERVILTMPLSKTDASWGFINKADIKGEDLEKETLTLEL